MRTIEELKAICYVACDYLRIHEALWPTIIIDTVPDWANNQSDYGASHTNGKGQVYIWLNLPLIKVDNVDSVIVLMHEVAHTYLEHGLKLSHHKELMALELERILFDLWDNGGMS